MHIAVFKPLFLLPRGGDSKAASTTTAIGKLHGFATSEAELAVSGLTLRGLVQCSPDIVGGSCESCLRSALMDMDGWPTTIIFLPSCNLRFDLFTSQIASPKPPVLRDNPPGGKVLIPVVVGSLSLLIILLGVVYLLRNSIARFYDETLVPFIRRICNRPQVWPLQYTFRALRKATKNFSDEIGRGGFAIVYKGVLPDGRVIAVKRLSSILQGNEEFMKEVSMMANLRHKNLVGLSGFCLEGNERLLVSEYMPNGSLDKFLFCPERQHVGWESRFKIIRGIAQGMLYLHEGKKICIHRDLKPHNVLLDEGMEPKICDFGMARICGQQTIDASKIAGTFGYMAPEYVRDGVLSAKTDVYSFGVIVLEIVGGQKVSSLIQQYGVGEESLISRARKCWGDKKPSEFVDELLDKKSYKEEEVIRCIQLGLLCVEDNYRDRPNSEYIISALNLVSLAEPSQDTRVEYEDTEESYMSMNSSLDELIREGRRDVQTGTVESSSSNYLSARQSNVHTATSSSSNYLCTGQSNDHTATSSFPEDQIQSMDIFHLPAKSFSFHIP